MVLAPMNSTTCPPQHRLAQLLDEQLVASVELEVSQHLSECADCQAVMDRLTQDEAASAWPASERSSVPFDDPALVTVMMRLEQMLAEPISPDQLLDQPGDPDDTIDLVDGKGERLQFPSPPTAQAPLGEVESYQVLEKLGSGAMGEAFKARDVRLRRIVAIKVLKRELCALDVARVRIEREARAAASLKHDNIVTVHELRTPPDFPPYLVMEYVAGVSLKQKLDEVGLLEPREAAHIARQIAEGLAAADEGGVVHRDIKPSNIMIESTTQRVKITDFGLARVQDLVSSATLDGVIAGTPNYMSPEQILQPKSVDGRSDVYSLGVVLYELLTGEPPFRGVTRMVLLQVLNQEPAALRRLNDRIPKDLETICLKAIAKEPGRRYQSAAEMRDDLTRWLDGKPVLARPIGRLERLVRWSKRNPRIAFLSSVIGLLLMAGVIGWSYFTYSLAHARTVADSNADAIATQRDLAVSALNKMVYEAQNTLVGEPRLRPLRDRLLQIALDGFDEVSGSAPRESGLARVSSVIAYNRKGDVARELGKIDVAGEAFKQALDVGRDLMAEHDGDVRVQQALVFTLWNLGDIRLSQNADDEAWRLYEEALTLSRQIADTPMSDHESQRDLSIAYDRVGDFLLKQNRTADARTHYRASMEISRRLWQHEPSDRELKRDLAVICLKLGAILLELGDRQQAEQSYSEGQSLFLQLATAYPEDQRALRDLAIAAARLAELAEKKGDFGQAETYWTRSHEILRKLVRKDAENLTLERDLVLSTTQLGMCRLRLKGYQDAVEYLERAAEASETLADRASAMFRDEQTRVLCQKNLIVAEMASDRSPKAHERIRRLRDLLVGLRGNGDVRGDSLNWIEQQESELVKIERVEAEFHNLRRNSILSGEK